LLNKIAQYNKPVIASVGGLLFEEIDKLHMFFKNRDIPLSILHCVGLYPTKANEQALEYISDLHNRYPKTVIGLSSHGCPENWEEIIIGIAKDIEIYERHVDLEHKNTYSLTPLDLDTYLKVALKTWNMLYGALEIKKQKEGLRSSFMRGAYLKRDIAPNELITQDDLYFALPIIDATHLDGSECSKYITFQALCELKKDEPLLSTKIIKHNTRPEILDIMTYTKQVLKDGQIILPKNMKCEISHHYGLFNWDKYGMVLITLINQQYCKKLLILQAGQKNPEHYHKEKLETFFVLYGTAIVEVDGIIHKLKQGNMITIQPGQKHYISTDGDSDVIIEELSTNHKPNDSYYTDETITTNKHRKTEVYLLND
jgi:quercetin dioxygenase-like cupin family protein